MLCVRQAVCDEAGPRQAHAKAHGRAAVPLYALRQSVCAEQHSLQPQAKDPRFGQINVIIQPEGGWSTRKGRDFPHHVPEIGPCRQRRRRKGREHLATRDEQAIAATRKLEDFLHFPCGRGLASTQGGCSRTRSKRTRCRRPGNRAPRPRPRPTPSPLRACQPPATWK